MAPPKKKGPLARRQGISLQVEDRATLERLASAFGITMSEAIAQLLREKDAQLTQEEQDPVAEGAK